tara:strand:+ start:5034 stop:7193 length:2160 start_codon:yes stop_codon:yes gene_type:complete
MPSSIKLTEPLDILVEYGYLDDETPYHKAVSNAVVDFTDDKTLGGEYNRDYIEILQKEASKELKARRKKIDVKSFKENFLNKKEEPVKTDTIGESSIVPYKPPADNLDLSVEKEEEKETEGLKGIRDILDDILKVLRLDFKDDRKEARDARKLKLAADRKAKEDKLEGGGLKESLGVIGKSVGAMLSPFQKIWNALIKFLKFTLIGILFNKTLGWFSDPKNKEKAERIGKFFKDWWPALALAAGLWLTPLGALLKGVVGLLTAIIPKLVIAIAANPYAALALVGTGLAVYGITKLASGLGGDKEGENLAEAQNQSSEQLQEEGMGAGDAEVLSQSVTTSNVNRMTEGDTNIRSNTNMLQTGMNDPLGGNSMGRFNGGGFVNAQTSAQNFVQKYNEGGLVQNFQGGGLVDDTAIPMIKQHEGLRLNKYNDSRGFPTIGYGHLVERNENISDTITESQADSLFEKDYQDHKKAAMKIPGYTNASVQQKAALIDLTFNMGPEWVDGFPKFKEAFASGNYDVAANELIDSNWYSQVNTRGPVIVDLIRDTGGSENNLINSDNQNFKGGGLVDTYNNLTKIKNYKQGGFVSGPGGVDKVPARLTAGEFVMSKGAVQKFGVNTLASMNAAGGGTNVPTITQEYNEGGSVQYFKSGGIVGPQFTRQVGTPIVNSTDKTITLPTIPKKQMGGTTKSQSDIPSFRIPIISSQRSMVLASLGIEDLIGA